MFIDGIGISGYRSFGPELQLIGPFSKINIFAGQNNSGKSNILRYLSKHYLSAANIAQAKTGALKFQPVDKHQGRSAETTRLAFGVRKQSPIYAKLLSGLESENAQKWLDAVLDSETLAQGTGVAWFVYERSPEGVVVLAHDTVKNLHREGVLSDREWRVFWSTFNPGASGGGR